MAKKQQRFKDTGIELKVEAALKFMNVKYIKQYAVPGLLSVDFYLPKSHAIIEVDGCYWHSCPTHNPSPYGRKQAKDYMRTQIMWSRGFRVLRLWEHDVNALSLTKLTTRIASVI